MKKAALIAAALTLILSLAACGNRDNNDAGNPPDQNNASGSNATDGRDDYGQESYDRYDAGSSVTGGGTASGNGSSNGSMTNGSGTTGNNSAANGSGTANNGSTAANNDSGSTARSEVGNDLRRAADGVGDAVTGMVDEGRDALTRTTSTTTFQRMLDNARVHDTDGVLTDGENSRW